MKQVYNPYLPLTEFVPDGEPHNFNGRVYIYGSHDVPGGVKYCEGDYVTYSAPENDLTDWRYEGVIYHRTDDPSNAKDQMQLWAPDVTCGPDGRYYLYYCYSFYPEIGVAVSDSPAGPFKFYGHVHYPESINGGATLREFMPFDPAVLTDDDGRVYLYYGFAPAAEKEMKMPKLSQEEIDKLPETSKERVAMFSKIEFGENGMVAELEPDMLTLKEVPHVSIPGGHHTAGTGFEGHGFFEASSIRKVGSKYYFVYSSHKSHELCYAVSDKPDRDFVYGGTIVSNGDVGLNGRTEPLNTLGNNHGGMVKANGEWYIFYHRQTNGTEFSRQGCAEKIKILPDGKIKQVEITSCGLNGGPLKGEGTYPAVIACNIVSPTNPSVINYQNPVMKTQTRITEDVEDGVHTPFITDIAEGTKLGYKYFDFEGLSKVTLTVRGKFHGTVTLSSELDNSDGVSETAFSIDNAQWTEISLDSTIRDGVRALYLTFKGEGKLDLETVTLG